MKHKTYLITILVFVIASAVYLAKPLPEPIHNDAGLYAYQAQQLLEGVPPYQSVFNGKMPLGTLALIPGIHLARVVGWNDVHGIQYSFIFVGGLLVALIFLVCKELTGSRPGAFLAAVYFLGFKSYSVHLFQFDPKVVSTVFQTLFLYLIIKRKHFWAGVAVGCSIMAWQPSCVLLLTGLIGCAGQKLKRSLKNLGYFILGGSLAASVVVLYFVLQGAFSALIQSTIIYPLTHHYNPAYLELKGFNAFTYLINHTQFDSTAIHLGVVLLMISIAIQCLIERGNTIRSTCLIFISFISVLGWAVWDFGGYPDLSPLLIYPCIGVAMAYQLLVKGELKNQIIFVLVLSTLIVGSTFLSNQKSDQRKEFYRHVQHLTDLMNHHAPDQKIMVYGDSQVPALLRIKHPIPYLVGSDGHEQYIEQYYPGGMVQWINDFISVNAGLVFVSTPHHSLEQNLLQNGYERFGNANKGRSRVYIKHAK